MFDTSVSLLAVVIATFFAAGLVKGVTGMGLPTVAMGLLGALLTPLAAAGLLLVPSFVTNIWQLLAGPSFRALAQRLWPMMVAVTIGTITSSSVLTGPDTAFATLALGVVLVAYALYALFAPPFRVPAARERWLSPLVGLATGLITGATGIFVIPAVPYLQALGLEKDDLVQALGLSFTVSTVALALGLGIRGAYQIDGIALSVLAVIPAFIGMWAGQAVRRVVSAATFKRWFLITLALIGAQMIMRGVL